jgi:DDE superfamily endonuclease
MGPDRINSATTQPTVPTVLVSWLTVFRPCFTAPVWNHILVLVAGAVLAPGKRTVTQALRVMGLADRSGFGRYHEVLNRARWDARDVARRLLLHLLAVLLPSGEVVIGIDDTIERRWGGKIKARGIYRDAVRSSHGHFVKTSGLRWLSLAVMLPVPFAGRRWALPFLTVLAPSARWSEAQGKRHKALTDWARLAKVPPAQPVECQTRESRQSFKPNAGCRIAVWWSSLTAVSRPWNSSPLYVGTSASSPGCVWMPACSSRHRNAGKAKWDGLH